LRKVEAGASYVGEITWPEVTNPRNPDNLWAMVREISAGGVVVRRDRGGFEIAVIEPQKESSGSAANGKKAARKETLALPKGIVDPGEKPEETALREVREETGLTATPITKITDIKYVYVRSWGDQQKVFKIVSFYLLRYESGEIDDVTAAMRIEVKRALWIRLDEGVKKLSYRGERDVVRRAQQYLESHPEV
jgi:8-oxo-dGTP pyrophosphatase MutT (NUDIX family)